MIDWKHERKFDQQFAVQTLRNKRFILAVMFE